MGQIGYHKRKQYMYYGNCRRRGKKTENIFKGIIAKYFPNGKRNGHPDSGCQKKRKRFKLKKGCMKTHYN